MSELDRIVARIREDLARGGSPAQARELEAAAARRTAAGDFRDFPGALADPGRLSLIAEHKRRSPSAGAIREDLVLEEVVRAYTAGGAAALSVLTERHRFGGSLEDLAAARAASPLPILRKDFIVEEIQLLEALAHGADAVLLIVAALPVASLARLHDRARESGLAVLTEVHDERELEVALEVGAEIIGVNNRDLTTLHVDPRRTLALLERIPSGRTIVAESGYTRREQLIELWEAGVDAVLIGEALMRSPGLEAAVRDLLGSAAARRG